MAVVAFVPIVYVSLLQRLREQERMIGGEEGSESARVEYVKDEEVV